MYRRVSYLREAIADSSQNLYLFKLVALYFEVEFNQNILSHERNVFCRQLKPW